jgi:hypothetical protein
MSKIITSQVRAEWAEATFRYDDEATFNELFPILRRLTPNLSSNDETAIRLAGELSQRALTIFAESLPKQLDALMGKLLTDSATAAFGEKIDGLTARGLTPRAARKYQAQLREWNSQTDAYINRQLWGEATQGRTPDVTLSTLHHALKTRGEGATQREVAKFLNVHVDSVRAFQKKQGFKGNNGWQMLKQHVLASG